MHASAYELLELLFIITSRLQVDLPDTAVRCLWRALRGGTLQAHPHAVVYRPSEAG